MVWYKDAHNRILRANRAAAQAIGMDVKDVQGCSLYDLFPSEAVRYHQDDLEVMRTGQPKLGINEPFRLPSGEVRLLRTHKVPYRSPEGKIIGPLEDPEGFTIVKVTKKSLGPCPPLSKVREMIEERVRRKKTSGSYDRWIENRRKRAMITLKV